MLITLRAFEKIALNLFRALSKDYSFTWVKQSYELRLAGYAQDGTKDIGKVRYLFRRSLLLFFRK